MDDFDITQLFPGRRISLAIRFSCFGATATIEECLAHIFDESGHTGIVDFLRLNNNRLITMLMPRFIDKNLAQRVEEIARYFADSKRDIQTLLRPLQSRIF